MTVDTIKKDVWVAFGPSVLITCTDLVRQVPNLVFEVFLINFFVCRLPPWYPGPFFVKPFPSRDRMGTNGNLILL